MSEQNNATHSLAHTNMFILQYNSRLSTRSDRRTQTVEVNPLIVAHRHCVAAAELACSSDELPYTKARLFTKKKHYRHRRRVRKEVIYVEYGVTPKRSCTISAFKQFEGYQIHF